MNYQNNNKLNLFWKTDIGKKCNQGPTLKLHKDNMKNLSAEKYLGDMISGKGTNL